MKHAMQTARAIIGAVCILAPAAQASPIINQTFSGSFPATISGTLPDQGTALEEAFTLPATSDLTVTTTSYASGGFEPNLLLFDSMGGFITAGTPFGIIDPSPGIIGDMRLVAPGLSSGMYTVALTDFLLNQSLTATNLSDGFTANYGSGTTFVDSGGNPRTGNFAFTISAGGASPVPEPATLWITAPFLAWVAIRARKRLKT